MPKPNQGLPSVPRPVFPGADGPTQALVAVLIAGLVTTVGLVVGPVERKPGD